MLRDVSTLNALPCAFAAGTTVQYTRSISEYRANDGWQLKLYLAGAQTLNVTASASGPDFIVTMTAAQTATLTTAGQYRWTERVTKGALAYDVATGTVEVTPNLATATPGSLQAMSEKLLAAVEAVLAGKITDDASQYVIAGRSITLMSRQELLALHNKLQWDVARLRGKGKATRTRRLSFTGSGNES